MNVKGAHYSVWRRIVTGLCALTVTATLAVATSETAHARPGAGSPGGSSVSFVDDFDGPAGAAADSSKWSYQTGGSWNGGTQLQQYTPGAHNAALTGNGTLLITARGETYTGTDKITRNYTSARLISKQSVLYGTMSARIRMTGSPGAWPAFWSMGANYPQVGWPACGEIDTMEAVNNYPNLYGSFHGPVANAAKGTAYNAGKMTSPTDGLGTGWHVYSADWTPTSVTFLLDGTPYSSINRADLPANNTWALDSPENLILNIAVGGGMPGNTITAPANFKATMEVDYVKVTNDIASATSATQGPAAQPETSAPAARRTSPVLGQMSIRYSEHGRAYLVGWVKSARVSTRVSGQVSVQSKKTRFAVVIPKGGGRLIVALPTKRRHISAHVSLRLKQIGHPAVLANRTIR